jgi:hypothetical protein
MFSALIFLIFFKPADLVSLMINKRHIMLTRMSRYGLNEVDPGQGFSDFALDFLISGITILICFWIHVILHTQLF